MCKVINVNGRAEKLKAREKRITDLVDAYYGDAVNKAAIKKEYEEEVLEYWLNQHNITSEEIEKTWLKLTEEKNKELAKYADHMSDVILAAETCLKKYDHEKPFINYLNFSLGKATMNLDFEEFKDLYVKTGDSKFTRVVIYNSETSDENDEESQTVFDTIEDESNNVVSMDSYFDALSGLRMVEREYNASQERTKKSLSLYLTNDSYKEGLPYMSACKYSFFNKDMYKLCTLRGRAFKDQEIAELLGKEASNYNRIISTFRAKLNKRIYSKAA